MRRTLHWFLLCALILPSSLVVLKARAANPGLQVETVNAPVRIPADADFAPNTVLVGFKKNVPSSARLQSVRRHGLAVDISNVNPDFARLQLGTGARAAGKDLYGVIADLRKDPTVQFAEPDYVVRAAQAPVYPTDPAFDSQYGLFNFGQNGGTPDADSDAPEAWAIYKGRREVRIAVVDTGIDYNHEDLRDNCIAGNGFDYANNDADPMDDHGHGTQVAGVIGGRGGNNLGIAGVNHVVSLIPIKVLNNAGVGTASAVATGIQHATANTARVINLSLDLGPFQSTVILNQINAAGVQGILVVAAAGNGSAIRGSALDQTVGADLDTTPYYPAAYNRTASNMITVASTDRNDNVSVFSNYGANTVDIAAAGEAIVTTTIGGGLYSSANPVNGTSYAAAMVSGTAGLVWAANFTRYGALSAAVRLNELKHRVLGSSEVLPSLQGKVVGARRLNIYNALAAADTVDPGIPVNFRVIRANSTSVILRWIAAGDDGSTGTVTAYDMRVSTSVINPATPATFTSAPRVVRPSVVPGPEPAGAPQEALIAGLNGGTTYWFAVRSIDEMGRVSSQPAVVSYTPQLGAPVTLLDDDAVTQPAFSVAAPWAANQTDATAPSADQRVYMDSPAGNYAASLAGLALTSTAPITLNVGNPSLSYTLRRTFGNAADRLEVGVSTDGGASYTALRNITGSSGFTTFNDSLAAFVGQTVTIAFRMFTDAATEADGVAIDHISITGTQTAIASPYFDDAEGGSSFTFTPAARGWARSADDNFTPGGGFNYSDSPGANYPNANPAVNDPANVYMYHASGVATLVDFTPVLQFRAKIQLETDRDFFFLRISGDGGVTFGEALRMTGIGNTAWTLFTVPLYGAYGKNIAVMFQTFRDSDTGTTQRDGVHIDDIRIGGEALVNVGGAIPNAPSGLEAFPTSSTTTRLDWVDNANNETNFRLERRVQFGTFSQIALLPADTLTYSDSGLQPDTTYEYRVRATNADGDSAFSNIDPARTSVPTAPNNMSAIATSASTVRLTWFDRQDDEPNSEGDQNATGFVVERSDDNGITFTQLALVGPSAGVNNAVTYDDGTVLTGRSYIYRAKARNWVGDSTYATSNVVRVAAPLPPGPLTATLLGTNNVRLNWLDNSTDETDFIVERSINSDFSVLANIVLVANPGAGTTQAFDTGPLTADTTFYYRVRARNAVGESTNSNIAILNYRVPVDPSGLTVTVPAAPAGITQLNLAWSDNSDNESNFQIRRSTTADFSAGVVTLALRPANSTSTTDTGLASGTTYYYQIRTVNSLGNGNYVPAIPVGAPATATTLVDVPAAPSSITATPLAGPARIDVRWIDGSTTETSFELEWSTDGGGSWTLLHSTASTSTATTGTEYQFVHSTGTGQFHTYRVRALNSTGPSSYRTLAGSVDMTLPAAPSNLTAVPLAGPPLQVQLNWQDNSNNETGFIIERSTDNFADPMNTILVATVGAGTTSRADTNGGAGLTYDTTYFYRVRATRLVGDSANSNVASARISVPAAPQNLSLSVLSNTQIRITFTDKSDNEDRFVIQRALDIMGSPGAFSDLPAVIPASSGIDGMVSHTDTNLMPITTYWYRVIARNGVGDSSAVGPQSATTLPNPPVEPTNLTAVVLSGTHVRLQWRDNSNNETMFEIERSTSGGAVITTFSVGANDEAIDPFVIFNDNAPGSVVAGNVYTYRVRAKNNNPLPSLWSNSVTADVTLPGTPGSVQANALNGTSIQVTWQDNSNNETGFKVERSTDNFADPMNTVLVTTTGAGTTVVVDNNGGAGLTPGTTYYYRVRSTNAVGDSPNSNVAFATTLIAPGTPQNLQALALSGSQIRLTWTDGSTNETGFRIERRQGAGPWTLLPTVINPNVTSHVDTGLTANTLYTYRVYAFNLAGNGSTSNEASATTLGVPASPSNLRLVRLTGNTVELAWDDNSNDEQGFRLERRVGAAGVFSVVATLASNTVTFTDSSLAVNTTYTYQVQAFSSVGNSGYSNALTVTTANGINPPSNLTATALSGRRVLLRWTDNSNNETYFRIERSLNGGAFREVAATNANITQYVDSGLTSGANYTYRIRAYRSGTGGGYSAYSNSASATAVLRPVRGRAATRKR